MIIWIIPMTINFHETLIICAWKYLYWMGKIAYYGNNSCLWALTCIHLHMKDDVFAASMIWVKNYQRFMVHALIIQHHVCRENLCRLGGSKFQLCSTFIDFLILLTQLASFSVIFFSALALTSLLSRGLISMALVVPMVFQTSFLINIV